MPAPGTRPRRSGLALTLTGILTSAILGLAMLLATPALARDGAIAQDFDDYPGIPVHRLWDPTDGDFVFTTSDEECTALQYDQGWAYDGVAFYTAADGDPVYRLTNPSLSTDANLWTTDFNEYTMLQGLGWQDDGVAWYSSGEQPVHRLYDPQTYRHCYTTSQAVLGLIDADAPWEYEDVAFTVEAPGTDRTPKVHGPLTLSDPSLSLQVWESGRVTAGPATAGTLSACSDDEAIATARVEGDEIVVEGTGAGTTTVSVQRTDQGFYPAEIGKVTVTVMAPDLPDVEVWRAYNPYTHEHLFTTDRNEYDLLGSIGWQQEGMAWIAPGYSSKPVYRLFNEYVNDHHYTTSLNEYETLQQMGWKGEGEKWYSDDAQRVPVYRVNNPYQQGSGAHQFTTDPVERQALLDAGWTDEGTGWYAIEKGQPVAPPTPTPEPEPAPEPEPQPTPPAPSEPGGGESGGGGTVEPPSDAEPFYWINTKSHIIHGDSCRSLANANLSAGHWRQVFSPAEAASYLAQGYTKCKNCRPTGI